MPDGALAEVACVEELEEVVAVEEGSMDDLEMMLMERKDSLSLPPQGYLAGGHRRVESDHNLHFSTRSDLSALESPAEIGLSFSVVSLLLLGV